MTASVSFARNAASVAGAAGEMPTTSKPAESMSAALAVKSTAWVVHPGVIAAG